jgi:hypothetical protein
MLTYRELQERKLGAMRHNDKVKRAQDDAESHGFEMTKPEKHKNDPSHTRFKVRRKPTKKNPEGGPWIDKVKKGDEEISTGTDKKDGTMGKVGRDSLKAAMKQDWKRTGTPNPEKRAEMKAGIGKPKKRTHDQLQKPSSRPSEEARKSMKKKALKREHSEWWLNMWRLDEGRQAQKRAERRELNAPIKAQAQKDAAAKQRADRNAAANKRVADAEAKARVGAPERRAQDQAAKDRAARNAAAKQRVADAEKKATRSNVTAKGASIGGTKQTMTSTARPANTIKKPQSRPATTAQPQSRATTQQQGPNQAPFKSPERMTPDPKSNVTGKRVSPPTLSAASRKDLSPTEQEAREKKNAAKAKKNIAKKKQGVGAGIKSSLGGDVIGMRGKKGETRAEKRQRMDMNKKNRGAFAKKKTQQAGNLAKSGASYATNKALGSAQTQTTNFTDSGDLQGSSALTRGSRS